MEVVEEDGAVDGVVGGEAFFFEAGEDAVFEVGEFEFTELELAGGEAAGGRSRGVDAEDALDVGLGAFPVELDVGVGVGAFVDVYDVVTGAVVKTFGLGGVLGGIGRRGVGERRQKRENDGGEKVRQTGARQHKIKRQTRDDARVCP